MSSNAPHLDRNCVELRGLQLGLRQAWRLRLLPYHAKRFRDAVQAMGFVMAMSRKRFADLEGGVLQSDDEGVVLAVVASQDAIAKECLRLEIENADRTETQAPGALAETLASHRLLGATYGYPDCCVDGFCDGHAQAVLSPSELSDNAWLIYRAAERTRTFHPLLRAFGGAAYEATASPLRHLPCRFDCPSSVELAAALIRDLERSNPALHGRYQHAPVADLLVHADGSVVLATGAQAVDQGGPRLQVRDAFPLRLSFRTRRYAAATD
jgi:hypothetical protein